MVEESILTTGVDIPFWKAGVNLHQPKYKEISFLGDSNFLQCISFLNFSKDILPEQDKSVLLNYTDFEVFMSIINSQTDIHFKVIKEQCLIILSMLFPLYKINILQDKIELIDNKEEKHYINKENFEDLKSILCEMFKLEKTNKQDYNPANADAQRIADKFKKRKQKLDELKKDENPQDVNIYSKFISILSVGLSKDINELSNYTIYQLVNEFDRFQKKTQFDIYIKAKMAGAVDLEDSENWML